MSFHHRTVQERLVALEIGDPLAVRGGRGDRAPQRRRSRTELIRRQGPWRTVDDVELATLQWVHWFNTERLYSALGDVPLAEFESAYDIHRSTSQLVEIK